MSEPTCISKIKRSTASSLVAISPHRALRRSTELPTHTSDRDGVSGESFPGLFGQARAHICIWSVLGRKARGWPAYRGITITGTGGDGHHLHTIRACFHCSSVPVRGERCGGAREGHSSWSFTAWIQTPVCRISFRIFGQRGECRLRRCSSSKRSSMKVIGRRLQQDAFVSGQWSSITHCRTSARS